MIIPTTESTLRMTLMQLSETKLELTAVTEQRDEMTLRWELTNDSLFDKRALADRLAEELKETKKHLKDANRGAEINAHALRINADKLAAVTEQRDRLAETLNNNWELLIALQHYFDADYPIDVTRIHYAAKLTREALQSLNQNDQVEARRDKTPPQQ